MYLLAAVAAVAAWMIYEKSKAAPVRSAGSTPSAPGSALPAAVTTAQATLAAQIAAGGANPGGQFDGFGGS